MFSSCYLLCLSNSESTRFSSRILRIIPLLLEVTVSLYDTNIFSFSVGIWIALSSTWPRSSVSISQMFSTGKSSLLFGRESGKSAQKSRQLWDPRPTIPMLFCSGCLLFSFLWLPFVLRIREKISPELFVWCLCHSVCLMSLCLSVSSAYNVQLHFLL